VLVKNNEMYEPNTAVVAGEGGAKTTENKNTLTPLHLTFSVEIFCVISV
jgi:hypothetical protein